VGTGGQMMASRQRPKVARPKRRRTWAIRPVARPHSTPKGKKGYDRSRDRKVVRHERDDA
jgi:hypothetical protein